MDRNSTSSRSVICRRLAVAILASTYLLSGCVTQRKSFSVDSNSRVPFFGLELAPNDRSTSNEIRSIGQTSKPSRSWSDPFGSEARKRDTLPRIPLPRTDHSPDAAVAMEPDDMDQF